MRITLPAIVCLLLWIIAYTLPVHTDVAPAFASQCLMVLAWGLVLSGAAAGTFYLPRSKAFGAVLGVGVTFTLLAALHHQFIQAGAIAAATATLAFGACEHDALWAESLLLAILVAGLISVPLAGLQVLTDPVTRASWIPSNPRVPGRAVAFLGQPNLAASLFVWSIVALMSLCALKGWARHGVLVVLAAALGAGLEFTGSRGGLIELAVVGCWAWRSKALPTHIKSMAKAAFAGYLLGFAISWLAAHFGTAVLHLDVRAQSHSDVSSGRLEIWRDALALVLRHPFAGVGWGNFSFAWSLTEIPGRHPGQFDHAHNLPLQLAVEIGLPATLATLGALSWALMGAWRGLAKLTVADSLLGQTAGIMLATIGVHSLLEYPLWYSYFLLPSAFLLGTLIRLGCAPLQASTSGAARPSGLALKVTQGLGAAIVMSCLYATWDFSRVLQIYSPYGAGLFESEHERIEHGQRSVLFGALADYAAVLAADKPTTDLQGFQRPMHQLVDTRLLIALAQTYAARGDMDKARYLAQRVREFKTPAAFDFFRACANPSGLEQQPFQCSSAPVHLGYEDFLSAAP